MSKVSTFGALYGLPLLAFAAMCLGVFWFPFFFPPARVCISAAYAAGFNNAVAVVAAGVCSVAAVAAMRLRKRPIHVSRLMLSNSLPWVTFWIAAAIYLAVTGTLATLAYNAPWQYGEASQFLDRIDFVRHYGQTPYRDFQYAYGPLLLYLPAALSAASGLSPEASYFLCLLGMSVAGLYAAFWTTGKLIPLPAVKNALFAALAIYGLNPTLGMNYTYFRFASPVAALVWFAACPRLLPAAAVAGAAGLLSFSISPETGFGFGTGAMAYGALFAWRGEPGRLAAALCAWLGLAAHLVLFGNHYLDSLFAYMGGCFNFVVSPAPQTVALLAALAIAAPVGLLTATALEWALYAMSLALLPGALGRCDGGHVIWYGLPLVWLVAAWSCRYTPPWRSGTLAAVAALLGWVTYGVFRLYATPLLQVTLAAAPYALRQELRARSAAVASRIAEDPEAGSLKPGDLARFYETNWIATPVRIDKRSEQLLKAAGRYVTEFHPDFDLVADGQDELLKVAAMNRAQWVLLPKQFHPYGENRGFARMIFQFPVFYREVRSPYFVGEKIVSDLELHWEARGELGDYLIYRRKSPGASQATSAKAPQ